MYFTRFNPTFPIVHAPTFRPSAKRSLLLLSICSVGSLFLGSSYAVAQGVRIFERLNKAILASVGTSYMLTTPMHYRLGLRGLKPNIIVGIIYCSRGFGRACHDPSSPNRPDIRHAFWGIFISIKLNKFMNILLIQIESATPRSRTDLPRHNHSSASVVPFVS